MSDMLRFQITTTIEVEMPPEKAQFLYNVNEPYAVADAIRAQSLGRETRPGTRLLGVAVIPVHGR